MTQQLYNLTNNGCELETSLELLRMITETVKQVVLNPIENQTQIKTALTRFYETRKLTPLGDNLTTLEKVAVTASLASINAYGRLNAIEQIDSAIHIRDHARLMEYLHTCANYLYRIKSPSNYIRMSREDLSRRLEIARSFSTHELY